MDENENSRGRLARILSAAVLAAVAIRSFRNGKRVTGVLAGVGAGALGYSATSGDRSPTKPVTVETDIEDDSSGRVAEGDTAEQTSPVDSSDSEDARLRCAACGDPIVPGQLRGPNADNEIVHKSCMDTPAMSV